MTPPVAFFGRAGAGKTTAARVLARHGWAVLPLAEPIKRMLAQLPGVTDEHLYGSQKDEAIPLYGKSAREMLQTLGTEWGRELVRKDIWLRAWEARADEVAARGSLVVCDDGRYENEFAMFLARGVRCVLVRRPEVDIHPVTHPSERLAAEGVFDEVVVNDGTEDDLTRRVLELVR